MGNKPEENAARGSCLAPDNKPQALDTPDSKPRALDTPDSKPQALDTPDSKPQALDTPDNKPQALDTPDQPKALDTFGKNARVQAGKRPRLVKIYL